MMKNVYSVGQVNTYIENMFAQGFMIRRISVKGQCLTASIIPQGIFVSLKGIRLGRSMRSCLQETAGGSLFSDEERVTKSS